MILTWNCPFGVEGRVRGRVGPAMRVIQIVGAGCAKCRALEDNVRQAVNDLPGEFRLEIVSDIVDILRFDISATPALVVDGRVLTAGELPSADEIRRMLQ